MKNIRLILGLAVIAISIIACSSSQPLIREVKASINKDFTITKDVTGGANFTANSSVQDYHDRVVTSISSDLSGKGITVVDAGAEYIITVKEVKIIETLTKYTVNDSLAINNGSIWELSKVNVIVSGYVTAATGTGKSYPFSETKEKSEKATRNQGAMQYYKGENKSSNEYREKKLNDYVVIKLIGSCAYNGGKRAAKNIIKDMAIL